MRFKNLVLDQFQEDAIGFIEKNNSVVVSAATGTGKTLIADYLIAKCIRENKRVVYTAPIKALSNQKYRDFVSDHGKENIGIMTGDVVINATAPVLIMTTEIYRNMLVTKDPSVEKVAYVIFDEIHYINDIERGTVWEESVIFSPSHVRFLCLSATIPNAPEFADWIKKIKKHEVEVVTYQKRAVPLEHYVYDSILGFTTIKNLKHNVEETKGIPDYHHAMRTRGREKIDPKKRHQEMQITLIKELRQKTLLPCIFFVFSRDGCQKHANVAYERFDFTTAEEKEKIIRYVNSKITDDVKKIHSVGFMRRILPRGIAIHHAGLLPILKEIVENLFGEGLIKLLFATETFSVGINMPAKCVAFNSLEKYDGISFRYLNSKEYFQLAGRAGRRGIDKKGVVVAMIERKTLDANRVENFTSKDVEPIISQFKLCNNTVLNLVEHHTATEREIILKSSFDYYLQTKGGRNVKVMVSFNNMYKKLVKLGYIDNNGMLTKKGMFARHVYTNELLVSEIFASEFYKKLNEVQICVLIGALIYEEKKQDKFKYGDKKNYYKILDTVSQNEYVAKNLNKIFLARMNLIVTAWCEGVDFFQLMEFTNFDEGDIIRLFRQMIDLMRQVIRATKDRELEMRMHRCIDMLQRDVINVEF